MLVVRTPYSNSHLLYYINLRYGFIRIIHNKSSLHQAASKQFLYLHIMVQVCGVLKALVSHRQHCLISVNNW